MNKLKPQMNYSAPSHQDSHPCHECQGSWQHCGPEAVESQLKWLAVVIDSRRPRQVQLPWRCRCQLMTGVTETVNL